MDLKKLAFGSLIVLAVAIVAAIGVGTMQPARTAPTKLLAEIPVSLEGVVVMPPDEPESNLAWAIVQCERSDDRNACVLAANTIMALEESGQQVRACIVWGKQARAHCLDVETPADNKPQTPQAPTNAGH